jgi:glycopeptide antibiotics resistance protein
MQYRKSGRMTTAKRVLTVLALVAYGAVLIKVMVFKDVPTIHLGVMMLNFSGTDGGHPPNFVPFKTIGPYLLGANGLIIAGINLVGNIIFLVPIGVLAAIAHARMMWRRLLAVAIVAGLTIEALQVVLQVGIFDIDDVILNALGVVIGYSTFVILDNWMRARKYARIGVAVVSVAMAAALAVYVVYPKGGQPMLPAAQQTSGVGAGGSRPDLCGGTGGTGQIVAIGSHELTIKRNDGVMQTLKLTDHTVIKTPAGEASESDLKTGDRVTLVVLDRSTASTVLVCDTPSSTHRSMD